MNFLAIFLKLPRWVLTSVCFALIVYLTLVPKPLPDNDIRFWEHSDKLVHAVMFGSLYVCTMIDAYRLRHKPSIKATVWLSIAIIIFGGLIEYIQQAMQMGRGGSVLDFMADIVGVIAAAALMLYYKYS